MFNNRFQLLIILLIYWQVGMIRSWTEMILNLILKDQSTLD